MSQIRTILVLLLGLFIANLIWGGDAHAQGGFQERSESRESTRWTLSEWLEQRDRNRMMDLWLSMNSPSPFEVMVGAASVSHSTRTGSLASRSFSFYSGEVTAYAQFVGLSVEYANHTEETSNDVSGLFNLRLLGDSLQNSSLVLHLGQRTRTFSVTGQTTSQRNLLSQASLQLYLAKYFGVDGHYRKYEAGHNDVLAADLGGHETQAGLFIDFKAVRVFGAWWKEQTIETASGIETATTREGIRTGLRIYY